MKITNHAVERWSSEDANAIFNLPFFDLLSRANSVLRESFEPNSITVCTLFSIKTGSCPEDCKYCSQSAHYNTGIKKEPLVDLDALMLAAKAAKESGATRFCMGAAWRSPKGSNLTKAIEMIKAVKGLGLETCVTFGLLNEEQALELKAAGLDYYNHNIDTSEQFYDKVITTRTFQDRLNTLKCVRDSGINVCSGGIVGMGESAEDRIQMLLTLSNLPKQPESVPLNMLVQIPGTPLADAKPIDNFDFVRLIALARIMMPNSYVRLSAGRESMSDELQALCFFAGANSIFYGDKLLTTGNNEPMKDDLLLAKFGLKKIYPNPDL